MGRRTCYSIGAAQTPNSKNYKFKAKNRNLRNISEKIREGLYDFFLKEELLEDETYFSEYSTEDEDECFEEDEYDICEEYEVDYCEEGEDDSSEGDEDDSSEEGEDNSSEGDEDDSC